MLTQQTRRWYHRFAVLEHSIDTGQTKPIGWYVTESGAQRAVDQLNFEYLEHGLTEVQDWYAARMVKLPGGVETFRPCAEPRGRHRLP